MNSNDFSLDLNKKSCRICLRSRANMFALNDYDLSVNKHMTLLEMLEFVKKTKESLKQIEYICVTCKQKLCNAFPSIKHAEKSEHILQVEKPEEKCTSFNDDDYLEKTNDNTGDYILPHELKELDNDHSNNNKEKTLKENEKNSSTDESWELSDSIEIDHDLSSLLSPLTGQSTPNHKLVDSSNNREPDLGNHEETVCYPVLLKSIKTCQSTSIHELIDPSNNHEPDSVNHEETVCCPLSLLSIQTGQSTPTLELIDPSNNHEPDSGNHEETVCDPLSNSNKDSFTDESWELSDSDERNEIYFSDSSSLLSPLTGQSSPIHELIANSNNHEPDSGNHEETVCDPLSNSNKDSFTDESWELSDSDERDEVFFSDSASLLSPLTSQSTPIHELIDPSNNREPDSGNPEETFCDPLSNSNKDSFTDESWELSDSDERDDDSSSLLSPLTSQSTPNHELIDLSNNLESDSGNPEETFCDPLSNSNKDSSTDESWELSDSDERDEVFFSDSSSLLSPLTGQSTPNHELVVPSNNSEPDSDNPEEIVCDPLSLTPPKTLQSTRIRKMMVTSSNRETDSEETVFPSSQTHYSTLNNEDLDSVNQKERDCNLMPLKNATTSSLSSTPQTLQTGSLCEMASVINEFSDSDNPEEPDDFQVPYKKPRITTQSSLETINPMTLSSNTNALYICKYCSRSFSTARTLKRHITILHYDISRQDFLKEKSDSSISCKYCPRIFKREYNLTCHLNSFHPDEATILELEGDNIIGGEKKVERQSLCPYCGKSYAKASLTVHMRRHTGVSPFKCDVCKKAYPRRQDLDAHFRCHTGEKPYTCIVCKKSFSTDSKLSRHMYLHVNQNRLICQHCGKGFSNSGDLKIHLRRHTGELPYICDVCQKHFISVSSLNRHRCPVDVTQTKENEEPTNTKN